jgi:hypothetical protein
MNTNGKSTKNASREAPDETRFPESPITDFATLMQRNVARLLGLQKTTLETLGEQTADVAEVVRNTMRSGGFAAAVGTFDVTEHGVQSWIGMQKELLEMTLRQSEHSVNTFRKRGGSVSQWMKEMAEFAQQTTERAVAAQRMILDFAAEQNRAVAEEIRRQPGVKGSPVFEVTDSVERGFDALIGVQREFLDSAQKLSRTAAAGGH